MKDIFCFCTCLISCLFANRWAEHLKHCFGSVGIEWTFGWLIIFVVASPISFSLAPLRKHGQVDMVWRVRITTEFTSEHAICMNANCSWKRYNIASEKTHLAHAGVTFVVVCNQVSICFQRNKANSAILKESHSTLTPSNHAKRGAGKARRRALAADSPGASHIVTQGLEAHHRGMRWQKVFCTTGSNT